MSIDWKDCDPRPVFKEIGDTIKEYHQQLLGMGMTERQAELIMDVQMGRIAIACGYNGPQGPTATNQGNVQG